MPRAKKEFSVKKQELSRSPRKSRTSPDTANQPSGFGLDLPSPQSLIKQRWAILKNFRPTRNQLVLLVVVGIGILAWLNKGWFVAATVNGQPITTFEVNQKLNALYKPQVLNQLINEVLVEQEANTKKVAVSSTELEQRLGQVMSDYGGREVFESLLSQQGLTYTDFVNQTRLQLLVEKIYAPEIEPTEEEIVQFMEKNKDNPEATEPAKFKATVVDQLKQSKLSQVFSEKFPELRNSANIQTF